MYYFFFIIITLQESLLKSVYNITELCPDIIYSQVRKLEFILADAVQKGCKHVITVGSIQSNHCRATVMAASHIGMKSHLFLRGDVKVGKLETG